MPSLLRCFSGLLVFVLLFSLAAISTNNVCAQEIRSRTNGDLTRSGFPRWITIDRPLFIDVSSTESGDRQAKSASPPVTEQTWQEDGKYVIVKLDGRELRLMKIPESASRREHSGDSVLRTDHIVTPPPSTIKSGGTVLGRLMNRGRPLVNCKVSLIPLRRDYRGHSVDGRAEAQSSVTDENGNYHFENVPPGPYKLFWLPSGQRRWIRRLEFKPDVVARPGETSHVKGVRAALRTLN